MSKIGMMGCGKLGLPVALAIESRGHVVMGYDISSDPYRFIEERKIPYQEENLQPLLNATNMHMTRSLKELVAHSDILFVPVQTPHQERFEGTLPLPEDRSDFDYTFLRQAIIDVANASRSLNKKTTVAVISTCLPGTYNREIKQLLTDNIEYIYTPQFVAMGTVLQDYFNPEFNLIGVESGQSSEQLKRFYATINDAENICTDITTAEGIKVSYNTWLTVKTVVANAWGEMSERLGMNFDDIKRAWDVSTKRLWSARYTDAGMSDGGGCHPRDNIALSYIARQTGMSHNIWEDLMVAREDYEKWHAQEIMRAADQHNHHIIILGRAFKPETNIETGSAARLLSSLINREHLHVEDLSELPVATYFIGVRHERYRAYRFPAGSVVIDPHGIINDQPGVLVRRLGRL